MEGFFRKREYVLRLILAAGLLIPFGYYSSSVWPDEHCDRGQQSNSISQAFCQVSLEPGNESVRPARLFGKNPAYGFVSYGSTGLLCSNSSSRQEAMPSRAGEHYHNGISLLRLHCLLSI